jgi:hypothetical protein
MTAALALQSSIRARLVSTAGVIALVPADAILDRNARPSPSPSIIFGEAQLVDEGGSISRSIQRVYMDLHIWKKEGGLTGAKAIGGAIRHALRERLDLGEGFHCIDLAVTSERFLRDPDGETAHGIVTVTSQIQEIQ